MNALSDAVIDWFASAPTGTRQWLPGLGRSMAPLLHSGDAIEFERVDGSALRPGDIALARLERGRLVAHLVESSAPLRTMSLRGVPDAGELEVLGRAVALRRGGSVIPLPRLGGAALLLFARGYRAARTSPALSSAFRAGRAQLFGNRTRPLRQRLLGELKVRKLDPSDTDALVRFVSDHGRLTALFAQSRLVASAGTSSVTFGAFARGGRLLGMCLSDESQRGRGVVVHKLFVAPTARNLGIGRSLLQACIDDARLRGAERLFANSLEADEAGLRLLSRLGFVSDPSVVAELRGAATREASTVFEGYWVLTL